MSDTNTVTVPISAAVSMSNGKLLLPFPALRDILEDLGYVPLVFGGDHGAVRREVLRQIPKLADADSIVLRHRIQPGPGVWDNINACVRELEDTFGSYVTLTKYDCNPEE